MPWSFYVNGAGLKVTTIADGPARRNDDVLRAGLASGLLPDVHRDSPERLVVTDKLAVVLEGIEEGDDLRLARLALVCWGFVGSKVSADVLDAVTRRVVLDDALLALSFCGKSSQARALNAQAIRSIKQLLGQS